MKLLKKLLKEKLGRNNKKRFKIYDYQVFFFSFTGLILTSYFGYVKVLLSDFSSAFFFNLLVWLIAAAFLNSAFTDNTVSEKDKDKFKERKAVFSFQIFSWTELFLGIFLSALFGFWSYALSFSNGIFNFNWLSIVTILFLFVGLIMIRNAFNKDVDNKKD